MKVCFPVRENRGLESPVFDHFGSAPRFLLVDTESNEVSEVVNRDVHHAHGACSPLAALDGHRVDAVVVGGIGGGALAGLDRAGILVYRSAEPTIDSNIAHLRNGSLARWLPGQACGGHGHGHSCGHQQPA
jgi:predicted Fe-Mo cluster-binding NifX family protein